MDTVNTPNHGVVIACETVPMTDETPGTETPEHTQATFGMRRAAEVAGVSVSTIRRKKDLLRQHGAVIEASGWKVPVTALIAADLMRARTPAEEEPATGAGRQPATVEHESMEQLRQKVQQLQQEVERERHRAELAEERQRSAEREARDVREFADSLSETLTIERRMLTAGTGVEAISSDDVEQRVEAPAIDEGREEPGVTSRWWRKLVRG